MDTLNLKKLQLDLDILSDPEGWKRIKKLFPDDIISCQSWMAPVEYLTQKYSEKAIVGYISHLFMLPSTALYLSVKEKDLELINYYLEDNCPITLKTYWLAIESGLEIFEKIHRRSNPKMIKALNHLPDNLKIINFLLNYYSSPDTVDCLNHLLRLIYHYITPERRLELKLKPIWTRQNGEPLSMINIPDPVERVVDLKKLRTKSLTNQEVTEIWNLGIEEFNAELQKYYKIDKNGATSLCGV